MRVEKRQRIRKLYELERLVNEKGETKKVKDIRKELNLNGFDKDEFPGFDKELYNNLKREGPKRTDRQLAHMMGISTRTLAKGKKENGISKGIFKADEYLKIIRNNKGINDREVAELMGMNVKSLYKAKERAGLTKKRV